MPKDKLLITGGTGSFGNAYLNKAISQNRFSEIIVFSRDEKKQDDLRKKINSDKVNFFIGDVRDPESVEDVVKRVDYIFHAAALKQVPSCEFFPLEAVKTNILGTNNVLTSAEKFDIKKVVILSTDKAAYPINAMGMSKALMEKVAVATSRNIDEKNTTICLTRYGNVMASRGSIIPLFISQIKNGIPLTITDPNMTRYLMSLDDAVDLVIYAFNNAKQGDLFVQKAPAATIETLAKALLDIFNSENKIKIIGTRHGEKLYETLCTREEMSKAIDLPNFYRIPADNRDLNYGKYFSEGRVVDSSLEDYNSHNTYRLSVEETKKLLLDIDFVKEQLIN